MRPSGVNGMDAAYRMQVVSRYKRLPGLKRRLKVLAYANVVTWVLITIVQTLPLWENLAFFRLEGIGRDKLWLAAQAATGGAIWTFALYWAGTGGNLWRDDSTWLLSAYLVCNLLVALMAGVLLYFRKVGDGLLNAKTALHGIEIVELVLNLVGVSMSVAASIVAFQYLSLRQKSKSS